MKKNYAAIDIAKLFFALCIVGLHTGFLLNYEWGYYIHTNIFRIGVPFFFMASGFFLAKKAKNNGNHKSEIKDYIKKLIPIYLFLSIIYLILNMVRYNDFSPSNILYGIWYIFTGRSQSVMWFVGSLILSSLILLYMDNKEKLKKSILIAILLYIVGLSFNTYAFLINNNILQFLYNFLVDTFSNNSNVLFVGYLFTSIGYYFAKYKDFEINKYKKIILLMVSFITMFLETCFVKNNLSNVINYEYFLSHIILVPVVFDLLTNLNLKFETKKIRKLSSHIYYFHYAIIILLILINNILNLQILNNNFCFYIATVILTILISILYQIYSKNANRNVIIRYSLFALYSIIVLVLIFTGITLFNKVLWADEICSLAMIKNSYKDIFLINMGDVHPPVYYSMLKLFTDCILLICKNINPIYIGKIFSFIPVVILLIISHTKVSKKYGKITATIFSVFILLAPQMLNNYVELRMYSWAMCLVTLAFIYGIEAIKNDNKKTWILFTLLSALAAYIHLYSCLTMVFIYVLLLIYLFFVNKQRCKKMFISGMVVGLIYLPWLLVVISQMKTVSSGFWIAPITFTNIIEYIKYVIFPTSEYRIINIALALGIVISITVTLITINKNKNTNNKAILNMGILVPILVVGTGVLLSIINTPVFVARYMFCALGVFWFGISVGLGELIKEKNCYILLLIIPVLTGIINTTNFINAEKIKEANIKMYYDKIQNIDTEAILITNDIHTLYMTAYFRPEEITYIFNQSIPDVMIKMYGNIKGDYDINSLKKDIKNKKEVYYLELSKNDNNIKDMEQNNIKIEYLSSYSADWYYMNLYQLR